MSQGEVEVEDIYRLSPLQEGLLFHSLSETGSGLYVEQSTCTLRGRLDRTALRRAWQWVTERHPPLRTAFHWEEVERPVQVVHREVPLRWREEDWTGLPESAREARFAALAEAERRHGFELAAPPLLRLVLVRLAEGLHRFVWSYHHLLMDGWSVFLLLREVFTAYEAFRRGAAPHLPAPRPYVDYVAWLAGQDMAAAEAFWRQALAGLAAPTRLPLAAAAPGGAPAAGLEQAADPAIGRAVYGDVEAALPAATTGRLEELARRAGVTLGTVVHGAWALLLARLTEQEEVVFGSVAAGRPPHLRGAETMVGLFINTLPVRVPVPPRAALLAWLDRLQRHLLDVRRHEHSPLSQVQRWSPLPAGEALFESLVAFENYPRDPGLWSRAGDLEVSDLATIERTNYPVNLAVLPGERILLRLTCDRRRLPDGEAARWLARLRALLEGLAGAGDPALEEVPWMTPEERRSVLLEQNDTGSAAEGTLHGLFEDQARRSPGAPAVADAGGAILTYGELDERSARLARRLRALGAGPEARVAVCVERTGAGIAALLGVLRAGAAFVPLDPDHPAGRLRALLADSGARLLVADHALERRGLDPEALASRLASRLASDSCRVVRLEELDGPPQDPGEAPAGLWPDPAGEVDPAAAAYVIYTSGSTGRPKGVVVPHRAAANLARAAGPLLGLAAGVRVAQTASFAFDAAVLEVFAPLAAGACVCPVGRDARLAGAGLAAELGRRGIGVLVSVPSLLATLPAEEAAGVEVVMSGAERCPPELAARWAPGRRFWNVYGPTEATIFATAHEVPPGSSRSAPEPPIEPPIGRPIAGVQAYVLDRGGRPVPDGFPGELHLGGAGLARGYLGRPDLTAGAFVPHPFASAPGERLYRTGDRARRRGDGELEFLGRLDAQVKIRGHRVEPGEVEAALCEHPAVARAAVVARAAGLDGHGAIGQGTGGGLRLAAFVEPAPGGERPDPAGLRGFLAERLPAALVPAAFAVLDALPLTAGGKVDRAALGRLEIAPQADAAGIGRPPATAAEIALAGIWAQVLGRAHVGVEEDFFALGGDSILSIQVCARAAEAGLQIVPRQLFEHPTVAALAAVAGAAAREGGIAEAGPAPLTPVQSDFFDRGLAEPHHWNMAAALAARSRLDPRRLARVLQALSDRHDALRLRFVPDPESGVVRWRQEVAPAGGAAPFFRVDLTALSPAAAARAWESEAPRLQAGLDLGRGVLRAVLFEEPAASRLLLVVHHLAVDAVSWSLLRDELERAYRQLEAGGEVRLPPATTSFRRWAGRLAEWARSAEAERELPFWNAEAGRPVPPLPLDDAAGDPTEAAGASQAVDLDPERTRGFLKEAHRAYQTRPDELLLAALAAAWAAWAGEGVLAVDVEGHGREAPFGDVDLTRTVGWLTSLHPVVLDLREAAGAGLAPGEVVKAVKEQLRRVPGRGLGYGALRWRADAPDLAAPLRRRPRPAVSFNYLGQLDLFLAPTALLDLDPQPPGTPRSPRAERPYLLEINAFVRDGRLQVDLRHGGKHRPATVARLAGELRAALVRLIDHCLAPEAGGYTPSDFPAADLDQRSLDRLLRRFGDRRSPAGPAG